jgi:hypothetical protein
VLVEKGSYATYLKSNRKFSNKLIGLYFMACIFLFLSPRSILVFEKIYIPLQNLFIIFYQFKGLPFKVLI